MTTMEISNRMIYELLKEFKADVYKRFDQIDGQFAQVNGRFEQMESRFGQMDRRLDRIENQQTEDRKILMNLWENRENMKLSLTRSLLTVTGIISGAVAIIVSFITGKAIIFSMKN